LGKGDGTFQPAVNYGAGRNSQSVAAADFNSDGKLDLVVVNGSSTTGSVSVLLGKGDGTFQTAVNFAAGRNPESVAVGDFNGDGKADVVVANDLAAGSVSLLLGKGDGTFQAAVAYAAGTHPVSVRVGDFNGDAKNDVVAATDEGVSVLLGNGDGTFEAPVSFPAGSNPVSVAIGDFNGDGLSDLAVVNYNTQGTVTVLLNTCLSAGLDLAIARTNTSVIVSWSFPSTGFVLESTTGVGLLNWQPSVEVPTTNNGRWEVSVPPSLRERYFRLRKP
jgi:uncharacterized protein YfaP (DUF2135 family)